MRMPHVAVTNTTHALDMTLTQCCLQACTREIASKPRYAARPLSVAYPPDALAFSIKGEPASALKTPECWPALRLAMTKAKKKGLHAIGTAGRGWLRVTVWGGGLFWLFRGHAPSVVVRERCTSCPRSARNPRLAKAGVQKRAGGPLPWHDG